MSKKRKLSGAQGRKQLKQEEPKNINIEVKITS